MLMQLPVVNCSLSNYYSQVHQKEAWLSQRVHIRLSDFVKWKP